MSRKDFDRVLGHADEADGIEEYDNPLPDWWLGLFFFTILFAIGYTVEWHFISGRSQAGYYEAEMAAAKQLYPEPESPDSLTYDEETLAAGKGVFESTCASCHGANLEGGIGPNLKDAEWIHGFEEKQVLATISEGVAAKGMPAWGGILGPKKVSQVAAYVLKQSEGVERVVVSADAVAAAPAAEGTEGAADAEGAEGTEAEAVDPLVAGEAVFAANCVACHKADMTGSVGPSLVDDEWIHGGSLEAITDTITKGVPEKGMVSWGPILGEEKIAQVAAYVYSKSHPEDAKNEE